MLKDCRIPKNRIPVHINSQIIRLSVFLACLIIISSTTTSVACSAMAGNTPTSTAVVFRDSTRENVNYTKLCMDYIKNHYTGKDVVLVSSTEMYTHIETMYNYTYVVADINQQNTSVYVDRVGVTIRHDTLHLEFGTNQIDSDYLKYLLYLPALWNKTDSDSRTGFILKFKHLPTLVESENLNYNIIITFSVVKANEGKLTNELSDLGYHYHELESLPGDQGVLVGANMTIHDALQTMSSNYVESASMYTGFYEYAPPIKGSDSNATLLVSGVVTAVAACSCIIIFVSYKRKRKSK